MPVIVCGDLNIAHKHIDISSGDKARNGAGITPQERNNFSNFLEQRGFVDTFRHQNPLKMQLSYWSEKGISRIINKGCRCDYFLASAGLLSDKDSEQSPKVTVGRSLIHTEIYASDHCPISLELVFKDDDASQVQVPPAGQAEADIATKSAIDIV